jgi:hypothetical protein
MYSAVDMLNCFSFGDFYASLITIFTVRKKLKCTYQRDSLPRYFPLYFLCTWIKIKLLSNSAVLRKIFQILNMGPETSESKLYSSVCPCQFFLMDSIGLEYYIMYCTWIVGFDLLVQSDCFFSSCFRDVNNDSAVSKMIPQGEQCLCCVNNDTAVSIMTLGSSTLRRHQYHRIFDSPANTRKFPSDIFNFSSNLKF